MKLYGPTIRYNPKLFGEFFHRSNREGTVRTATSLATPLILNGLLRLFTTVKPDLIVSVHPMINFVTVRALKELGLSIPFVTVVTDLVSVHCAWYAPGVQAYIVPTEEARTLYLKRGLDPERIHVLGMPIDPAFSRPTADQKMLREQLGLLPDLPVVLLVGGGDGAGGLQHAVQAISQARLPLQLIVVTGHNRRLYTHLQRIQAGLHVLATILGFVYNMPELMQAADMIVTKAGPGTICEALACKLPIILSGYVPGQEEGNIQYVVEQRAGILALDDRTLVNELRLLLQPGSPTLQERKANAERISRPLASFDIARTLLSFLPPADAPGLWQSVEWQMRQQSLSARLQSVLHPRYAPRQTNKTGIKVISIRSFHLPGKRNLVHNETTNRRQ